MVCQTNDRTYINALKCHEILKESNSNSLFLDYDCHREWAEKLMNCEQITTSPGYSPNIEKELLNEARKDSRNGLIDNSKKSFNKFQVNKFMSMDIPAWP